MTLTGKRVDPIKLEIIRFALVGAAEEMKLALARTAYNPIISEVLDFSCAVFDRDCRTIAQADGLPIFLGSLKEAVEVVVADVGRDALEPGDLYLFNDPYAQGNHLNDVTTVTPVYVDGDIAGFSVTRAHWLDMGGKDPGGSLDATDVHQEGLRLRSVRLYRAGVLDASVWRVLEHNVRDPAAMMGDLRAQVAATRTGEDRLRAIVERHGRELFDTAVDTLIDHAEQRVHAELAAMPDGTYRAEAYIDDDGCGSGPLRVSVAATIAGDSLAIDLAGSAPQTLGPVNCGFPAALASCRIALKALTTPGIPANEGDFVPLTVDAPSDCIFNARYPASTFIYGKLLSEVVILALAQAVPDRAIAGNYDDLAGFMLTGTHPETGRPYIQQEPEIGGWGAHASGDGTDALIFIGDGDARNIPAEVLESRFPLRLERYELRPDSGGAGRFRGGLGIVRDYRIVAHDAELTCIMDRTYYPPWGLFGGRAGLSCEVVVFRPDGGVETHIRAARAHVPAGSLVSVRTGGGGGWGPPHERDPEAVANDVAGGYVTAHGG